MKKLLLVPFLVCTLLTLCCTSQAQKNTPPSAPAKPAEAAKIPPGMEVATLGGGCFWCIEAVFDQLQGVQSAESGYTGGTVGKPTYYQVSAGDTGHAEAVQIVYDPKVVTYKEILEIFFTVHDPTTLNRQGADRGTQYRSAIFYHNDDQKRIAGEVIREIEKEGIWNGKIVTEVTPFAAFYRAEDYHQEYFVNNTEQPYCQVVIAPKVLKFREKFKNKLKKKD
ncbi:MAG: peptide-methionine (S)-S-oxide reductase MsrA [Blastocatellia bacterium]|nr:peptide-methionine (S)-S-oxide reductase MsrA [Blastocatellia bacterium]